MRFEWYGTENIVLIYPFHAIVKHELSILKHLPIMLALCQHNTLAFYYAGIFDAGLVSSSMLTFVTFHPTLYSFAQNVSVNYPAPF